ncbi:Maf family protein [Metabacillus idriensis]|uniref:Maf family protein n=1 Tax=Metabacillus idriensis TaxID=324768 RepID=UPI00174D4043|nr:Maf family protein [Metabacillus idriensis]
MEQHLILASGSPRRKELLENVRVPFTVVISDVEEVVDPKLPPSEIVMSLAEQKAAAVADRFNESIVLGADTVVVYNGEILGKPANTEEAKRMLTKLSGNTHQVLTGVAILFQKEKILFYEQTDVTFWTISEEEIEDYIETEEPMDKAGSYGIQELGSLFVKEIKGDYFSVVGLPVARTVRELKKAGFSLK